MHDKMKLFELCETKAGLISSAYMYLSTEGVRQNGHTCSPKK